MEDGCCRDGVIDGEEILDIWDITDGSSFVQVLGKKIIFLQKDWQEVEYNLRHARVKWVKLVEFWGGRERIGELWGDFVWR